MDTISRRNTDSFEQALKDVTKKMFEQQQRLDIMQASFSAICERLNSIEKMVLIQKAMSIGHGASVK